MRTANSAFKKVPVLAEGIAAANGRISIGHCLKTSFSVILYWIGRCILFGVNFQAILPSVRHVTLQFLAESLNNMLLAKLAVLEIEDKNAERAMEDMLMLKLTCLTERIACVQTLWVSWTLRIG